MISGDAAVLSLFNPCYFPTSSDSGSHLMGIRLVAAELKVTNGEK